MYCKGALLCPLTSCFVKVGRPKDDRPIIATINNRAIEEEVVYRNRARERRNQQLRRQMRIDSGINKYKNLMSTFQKNCDNIRETVTNDERPVFDEQFSVIYTNNNPEVEDKLKIYDENCTNSDKYIEPPEMEMATRPYSDCNIKSETIVNDEHRVCDLSEGSVFDRLQTRS